MANYTVTTLDDELFNGGNLAAETADGSGLSLREALALTSSNGVSDAIAFAPGLAGGTLFLTSGAALEIIPSSAITIDGDIDHNGTPDITISADSALGANDATSRVITIADVSGGTTTLNGLVIRDGEADNGGGIFANRGLVLTNSRVFDNHATQHGGGVFAIDLTLTNVTISGNHA